MLSTLPRTWSGGYKDFVYDAEGRMTEYDNNGSTRYFAYDDESRITGISGAYTASYTYNGLDTRVAKTENSVSNTFKRDGVGVTAPVLNDGSAAYTPGISERRSSTTTYLHSGLKNAEAQTGTGQTVTSERIYDAFGNVLNATGAWVGPFGYAGKFGYQEDATGLKLLGHRYYDPTIGRFLTRDTARDGRNWYTYCENNPVSNYDADGLKVKFANGTKGQQQAFIAALLTLLLSKTAQGWAAEVLFGDKEYVVVFDGGGTRIEYGVIFIDMKDIGDDWTEGENGKADKPIDLVATLGHELSHLLGGVHSDGSPEQEAPAVDIERKIEGELGKPIRPKKWPGVVDHGKRHPVLPFPIIIPFVGPIPFFPN